MKTLYIAGFSRCGSTLLGSMLGQLNGWFNLGEARMIWQRSLIDDRNCGCGMSFSECETWHEVVGEFSSDYRDLDPAKLAEQVVELVRTRTLPITTRWAAARSAAIGQATELEEAVTSLYGAVQSVTGAGVLVDTSKVPMYARMLRDAGMDVRVVHLVRDPRGVAQSQRIPKHHVDRQATMGGVSIFNTAVSWNMINSSIERLLADSNYLRIGYRQLIEDPAAVLDELGRFMDEEATPGTWLAGNTATLEPTHSIFGNPGRFKTGEVRLTLDERWRELPKWKIMVVDALTLRLRRRYRDLL